MSLIEATGELQSERRDVWALVAEPYHLPDWWPAYTGVKPDRRGLAENARWQVVRSVAPGLLRRPEGEGLIVITGRRGVGASLARRQAGDRGRREARQRGHRPDARDHVRRRPVAPPGHRGRAAPAEPLAHPPARPLPDGGRTL